MPKYKGKEVPNPLKDMPYQTLCPVSETCDCFLLIICSDCVYQTMDTSIDYLLYKGWIDNAKAFDMSLSGNMELVAKVIGEHWE